MGQDNVTPGGRKAERRKYRRTAVVQSSVSRETEGGNGNTTVYRPVLIEIDGFAGFCLLRNLSPGGMMGSVYAQFAPGLPVSVQFNSDHVVAGTVVWSEDQRIGVNFDQEIDVEAVLQRAGSDLVGDKINRAPRLQIECQAEFLIRERIFPIIVRDISQRGIKAVVSNVWPGDEGVVRLHDMEPRKAVVRWAQAGTAGLNFIQPLGFRELAEWVVGLQSL